MIRREVHIRHVRRLLAQFPVVAVVGARQVGKTTLAYALAEGRARVTRLDLENPRDLERLRDAMLTLSPLRGLVIVDEVQRRPELFPVLRVLADRPRRPARFLVLGSAAPELLKQSSETLAGRVAYYELPGFSLPEVGAGSWARLWRRGGFPRSFLARTERESVEWRTQFIQTFLERDAPQLGFVLPSPTLHRFWSMLAHYHAQTLNSSELARAFGVADTTVRRWLDALSGAFMVRQLPAWAENLGKRQVRAPKVYVSDAGLLHALLDIHDQGGLERHPKVGASFEGFALAQIIGRLEARGRECYFWATHQGAELDLLVVRGRLRLGFEFKHTSTPALSKSMQIALRDLRLDGIDVVYPGDETFPLAKQVRAVGLSQIEDALEPLA